MRPERRHEVLALSDAFPLIARGAGHSYGDAALPAADGKIVMTERMDKFISYDADNRVLKCEAGVTLLDFFNSFVPRSAYLPVTPGISEITIGGCIAADIHSKNHWREGGFSRSVKSLSILTSEAGLVSCSRSENPQLFAATLAGYGLTGLIIEAELQLQPLLATTLQTQAQCATGIDELFARYQEATEKHAYAVGWIDYLNDTTPRGLVLTADYDLHAQKKEFAPWQPKKKKPLGLMAPAFNALSQSMFNRVFYAKHQMAPSAAQELRPFLFPWDNLANFNELYGKNGFYEYQCCVPEEGALEFFKMLSCELAEIKNDVPVYFAAFKRMSNCEGLMSYPFKGYSFLIDVKATAPAHAFLERLDALVCEYGGRVNLAKDARLSARYCHIMYPQTNAFLTVAEQFNKRGLRASAMAQRFEWIR